MKKYWIIMLMISAMAVTTQCKKEEEEKPDTTPPVITLKGSNPLNVDKGTVFVDPGFTATDDVDGDIMTRVVIDTDLDMDVEGTYHIKYNVSDVAGNKAQEKIREVKVMIF